MTYYKLISCLPVNIFDQQYKKQIIDVGRKVNLCYLWVKEIQGHRMACSQAMSYCLTARFPHPANSRSERKDWGRQVSTGATVSQASEELHLAD